MKSLRPYSFSLLALLLVLGACDFGAGGAVEARLTQKQEPGGTRFSCERSASSECNVVVYTQDCAVVGQDAGSRVVTCTAKVHRRFALKAGDSTTVVGLPEQHVVCVRAKSEPESQFPSCVFLPSWVRQSEHAKANPSEVVVERR
jgi:hypothetical protein